MIVESWFHELRLAWAGLRRARGFTGAAVLTLSLGMAGTTVMFALIEGVSDLLELIRARKKHGGILFAWRFDENLIKEKRFPTRKELDSVCPGQPLLLRRIDGHSCLLNSAALALVPGLNPNAVMELL